MAWTMGCCSIPEPKCCCCSISTWTYVLVFLGVLQLIGCIVMLAVPPPELCDKVPVTPGLLRRQELLVGARRAAPRGQRNWRSRHSNSRRFLCHWGTRWKLDVARRSSSVRSETRRQGQKANGHTTPEVLHLPLVAVLPWSLLEHGFQHRK